MRYIVLILIAFSATASATEPFRDVTAEVGLDFLHFNGMSGRYYFPEMMGSGVALFDYDADGDLDLYLVQGHMLGDHPIEEAIFAPRHPEPFTDRLYRNDGRRNADGSITDLRFTDVTSDAGLEVTTGYGMGVAAGDYNGDGLIDLYLTNYGNNQLLRNRGDGGFEDVTAEAGLEEPRWSVSAAFFDYDDDGDQDLYVGNYVHHDYMNSRTCRHHTLVIDYCGPVKGDGDPDSLFENLGDGRFRDVSEASGIASAFGGALGVIPSDFDDDGLLDFYVANDGVPNQMWMNQGDGSFEDESLLAGVSVNGDGMAEGSMGIDAADFDADGDEDIFITHFSSETNTLYVNRGQGWFEDRTVRVGLGNPSFEFTGFGTRFIDFDNDGWLDLLAVNGAVRVVDALLARGDIYPMHQRNQLFRNLGEGRFIELTDAAGEPFVVSEVGRGAAFGDIDNDGDVDVVTTSNAGPARLLLNQVGQDRPWIGARLTDPRGQIDAVGARLRVIRSSGPDLVRRVRPGGSYASSNDPRLTLGLGSTDSARVDVEVRWAGGTVEYFRGLQVGRYHNLRRGSGALASP